MEEFYDDTFNKLSDPVLINILKIMLKNKNDVDHDVYEQYFFLLEVNWDEEQYNIKFWLK